MLSVFARARRALARLRRANNVLCGVEQALRACSTPHKKSGERRRREQAGWKADSLFEKHSMKRF